MKTDDILHPDHRGMDRGKYREKMLKGELNSFSSERQFVRKDGSAIWGNRTVSLVRDATGKVLYFIRMIEDISERKSQELKITRLNRIHEVLSGINSAIVRIRDRQQLFAEACRIAVEHGKFSMSWIGMLDEATQAIRPVAKMGREEGYLERLNLTIASDNTGNLAMAVEAIARRSPVLCNDIAIDGRMRPWRAAALERGYRSSATFPLMLGQQAVGVFVLYASEPGFFDEEEMRLLSELAGDISFGLEHIAGQERIEKLSRVRVISSEINAAIVRIRDRQQLFEEACRIAVEHGNFGLAWIGLFDPATLDVTPVASAGLGSDAMRQSIATVRADVPQGQGVLGRAIRESRPVFDNDISVEKGVGGKRRQEALRLGYRSLIVLPLFAEGAVAGILALFEKEPNFFDEEEIKLLTELVGNISFALEHIAKEERIEKLSRIRAVSSEINAAIVRIRERKALLEEACRIASGQGKFEMIWIGTIDAEKQEIRPVAWTGFSLETAHKVSWKSTTAARGTLGEAVRTRRLAFRNDIEAELPGGGLRQEALSRGCHSTVCLPLVVDDGVVALVVLFASGTAFFDADELALLEEVAADLSYALAHIASEEKLDYLAYYDALTALPNRTLFVDRAGQQMRSRGSEPLMVALVLLNLERFRNINETFGRHGGDDLLKQVARRLEDAFHGKDYLARIGADGFGVVMRGVRDAASAVHAVEDQILRCFHEPYKLNSTELRVAARAGIALFPADGEDADTLFKNAEAALKKSRDSSERYLFYSADMNARAANLLSLETRLRKAVEAQQFVLHYQPKFNLTSGAICGLEALIRWQEPGAGLVAPGAFIPLLEETGLILEVGKWALMRALAQHREWAARGAPAPRVAVNVSAIQLQQKNFADVVVDTLQQEGANPDTLELEVTESLLMKDVQESIRKLAILRGMGITIAMDDFGTGYSSLSYIARLPITSVKIDRSFVNGMAGNPQDMSIVSTIITLAHSLNLRVVAEGVETAEQSKLLLLLKCDEAQGFLFSKPLPAAEIVLLLRAGSTSSDTPKNT